MNPIVDHDLCIGCGLCADLAPAVFEMGDDMTSNVIAAPGPDDLDAVQEAIDSCPTGAIS